MRKKTILYEFLVCLPRTILFIDGYLTSLISSIIKIFIKPNYQLTGSCKKRGVCCRNIGILANKSFFNFPLLKKIAINWYAYIYNFDYKGSDSQYGVILFKCNYLSKEGHCSIHWRRPALCRDYPNKRHFKGGKTLPGCGYRFQLDEK